MASQGPQQVINAAAPIRICDNGGWTDTWFAGHGTIFNIAVAPCVEVQIAVYDRNTELNGITVHAENYGERYHVSPGLQNVQRHPLLEAAIAELPPPDDVALEITLFSEIPAGASTGTSAAVVVALLGALHWLHGTRITAHEVARAAHRVETERLGLQSGIQDQLCSAYGGINLIDMSKYPNATVTPVFVSNETWWELERRLVLIFLGKTHSSSAVHEQVIANLEHEGQASSKLEKLRQAAVASREALLANDFVALGQAMAENTHAQRALHPSLVNADAEALIRLAQQHGALGWKVNGAGGAGGSLTVLCDESASKRRAFLRAVRKLNPLFQPIPVALSREGLRVWKG